MSQDNLIGSVGLYMTISEPYVQARLGPRLNRVFYPSLIYSKGLQTSDMFGISAQYEIVQGFQQKVLIGVGASVKDGGGSPTIDIEYRNRLSENVSVGIAIGYDPDIFAWQMKILFGNFKRQKYDKEKKEH